MSVLSGLVDMLHHASRVEPARLFRWLRQQPLAQSADQLIDQLVAALDDELGRALDAIYSEPRFQELERNWRSLHLIVDRLAGITNLKCEILNCSLEDLLLDFEDAPETPKSGLFKITHAGEFHWAGRPYAAIITSYQLGDDPRHLQLVRQAGETGAACSMPFVTHGTPELYASAAWDAFRATPEARFIVMLEGEYPLRLACEPTSALPYRQPAELTAWGRGSALLAIAMGLSFWRFRWAVHAFSPVHAWVDRLLAVDGRTVKDRPFGFRYDGLETAGVNALRDIAAGIVVVIGARTAAKPVASALPDTPEEDFELNTRLSALFLGGRIVQTMKIAYRGQIGTWKTREEIAAELTTLLGEMSPGLFESFELSLSDSAKGIWRYDLRLALKPISGVGTIVISTELDRE